MSITSLTACSNDLPTEPIAITKYTTRELPKELMTLPAMPKPLTKEQRVNGVWEENLALYLAATNNSLNVCYATHAEIVKWLNNNKLIIDEMNKK